MSGKRKTVPSSLRMKAEAQLIEGVKKESSEELPGMELAELVHKLQVHQVELEHQNEELRQAQNDQVALHQRYSDLFHRAPVGYLVLDEAGIVLDVNETFLTMTGRPASTIKNRTVFDLIAENDRTWFMARYKALYKRPERKNIELELLTGGGNTLPVSLEAILHTIRITDTLEYEPRLLLTVSDISERKRVEDALRAQTVLLSTVFYNSPNILMVVDEDVRVEMINRTGIEFSGNSREELLGLLGGEVFRCINSFDGKGCGKNPDCSKCAIRTRVMRTLKKGETILNEEGSLTVLKDARKFTLGFLISTVPVYIADKLKVMVTIVDITERKQADEALRQSELQYQTFLHTALDGFWIIDPGTGRILDVNDAYCQMSGYSRNEILQMRVDEFEIAESRVEVRSHIQRVSERGNNRFETTHRRKDGSMLQLEVSWQNILSDPCKHFVFLHDITARKEAEKALRESEEHYRLLFDEMLSGFALHEVICDEKGEPIDYRYLAINSAFEQLTGLKAEDLIGRTVLEVMPKTEPYWIERFGRVALEGGTDHFDGFSVSIGKYYEARAFCPEYGKFAVMFHDVTERKQIEDALAHERQRLSNVIEGTNTGIWEWNVQTGETVFNERWAEIVGYRLEELSPITIDTWLKLVHPDDIERSNKMLDKHFKGEVDYYECEIRMQHKNGNWIWVLDRGKVATWAEDGKPLLMFGTHQEINERKQAEENLKMLLQEKEILLAEVHHRVKNNMQIITSLLGLQASETEDKHLTTAFEESRQRILSMALVHEQLYRAREYAQIDFGKYIDQLASTLFNIYQVDTNRVELQIDCDEYLDLEKAIPCGLLLNELITNSLKYAFPEGRRGKLLISLKRQKEKMVLLVSDDGVGIPETFNIESAYSLGLQLVSMLASHDLQGSITLDQRNGTHFHLEFPV